MSAGDAQVQSYVVRPSAGVSGSLHVPGDKSISHRALMLSAIAEGRSEVTGFLAGEDCLATLAAMRALGVDIERRGESCVLIEGVGLHGLKAPTQPLDMGNAGTAMRLATGLLAPQRFSSRLIGDASLMKRPMERVAKPLREMGADIRTRAGLPPVDIIGGCRLRGVDHTMPVASAQVKSALLFAGLYAQDPTTVRGPSASRDHSERMLTSLGVRVITEGATTTLIPPQRLEALKLDVPGDFSSAAFFIVAALLNAGSQGLLIRNVGMNPSRTGLLDILRLMGGRIEVEEARMSGAEPVADLRVWASNLHGIEVPEPLVALAIDEFPVLFIAAACASGQTRVTGAAELRVKESDRLGAMSAGLRSLDVTHDVFADGMLIEGRPTGHAFGGGTVESHGDHRVAMAFTVASLRASAPIRVRDTVNVATSFPGFVDLAGSVGFELAVAAG